MELQDVKQKLKDNGLELVTITTQVIRPINVSEVYTSFFDEEILLCDLINDKSLQTKINRVLNRMEILLDEEEYKKI